MSIGLGLIMRFLEEARPISYLKDTFNITEEHFTTVAEKKTFSFVNNHFLQYGVLPNIKTVEKECNVSFSGLEAEPIGYWADKVINRLIALKASEMVNKVRDAIANGDVEKALDTAQTFSTSFGKSKSDETLYNLSDIGNTVLEKHNERQRSIKMSGIPFGIPYLDTVSDGAQPGDSIAFVGNTSVGKSFLVFQCAVNAYKAGYIPLVIPLEMQALQTARRVLSLSLKMPAQMIKHGTLSYWGAERIKDYIQKLQTLNQPFYILEGSLNTTIESIGLRIKELRPDIVYIDGGYLLRSSSLKDGPRWERIAYTAETIKTMAKDLNIPFVVTYQFNSQGPGLGNIGGSIAISQLASIVCSMEDEDDSSGESWSSVVYKILKLLKGRDGESGTIRLLYNMVNTSIEQESIISG